MTSNEELLKKIDFLSDKCAQALGDDPQLWRGLGLKHRSLIERFGFENFKRTINFEYGQWGITSLRSPFVAKQLINLLQAGILPYGGLLARYNRSAAEGIRWPDQLDAEQGTSISDAKTGRLPLASYALYCGLLWQYAVSQDKVGVLKTVDESLVGNPLPITYNRRLISQDLAIASLEINRIAEYCRPQEARRVLEIGGGYGRIAYPFCITFPAERYFMADISPASAISQRYLSTVLPGQTGEFVDGFRVENTTKRINFVLPHQLSSVPDGYFDLVINTSSFDEMPIETVANYFNEIDRTCKGYLYLNGHRVLNTGGTRSGLEHFPYREKWKLVFSGAHPVAPTFVERCYDLGGRSR